MRFAVAAAMVVLFSGIAHADGALVVVIDRAMSSDKIATVTHALTENLDAFDAADDIAIVSYAKTAHVDLALQSVSHRARVSSAVANIRTAKESNIVAGLRAASDVLAKTNRLRKYVLVLTEDDSTTGFGQAIDKLRSQNVQVSALGYQSSNGSTLKALCTNGGKPHPIQRANDLAHAFKLSATLRPPDEVAVVMLIDLNGSMRGKNLEFAKALARSTLGLLTPTDTFSLVTFDSNARVHIKPALAVNKSTMTDEIGRIESGIGTNYFTGLKEAFGILNAQRAANKHVILVGDGEAPSDGIAELLQDMRQSRITVSAVGVPGADRNFLSLIADGGDGRFYMSEDGSLPRIFLRASNP